MADIQADGGEDLSAAYSPDARHVLHVCGNPLGINGEILAGIKIFFAALFAGTGAFLSAGRYLFPVASLSLLFGYAFPGILIQRSFRISVGSRPSDSSRTRSISLSSSSMPGLDAAMKGWQRRFTSGRGGVHHSTVRNAWRKS